MRRMQAYKEDAQGGPREADGKEPRTSNGQQGSHWGGSIGAGPVQSMQTGTPSQPKFNPTCAVPELSTGKADMRGRDVRLAVPSSSLLQCCNDHALGFQLLSQEPRPSHKGTGLCIFSPGLVLRIQCLDIDGHELRCKHTETGLSGGAVVVGLQPKNDANCAGSGRGARGGRLSHRPWCSNVGQA